MGEAHCRDDVEAFLSTLCSLFVHRSLDSRKETQNRPIISILYTLTSLRVASSSKWVHICQAVNPQPINSISYVLFLRLHKTPLDFCWAHCSYQMCQPPFTNISNGANAGSFPRHTRITVDGGCTWSFSTLHRHPATPAPSILL